MPALVLHLPSWRLITSPVLSFPLLCSENVSFVFLVHPFDVGDMLLLNGARHEVRCNSHLSAAAGCLSGIRS